MRLYDASIHKGNEHQGSIKLAGNQFSIRHTQNHYFENKAPNETTELTSKAIEETSVTILHTLSESECDPHIYSR
jgi:hypothetical protein